VLPDYADRFPDAPLAIRTWTFVRFITFSSRNPDLVLEDEVLDWYVIKTLHLSLHAKRVREGYHVLYIRLSIFYNVISKETNALQI
jgi:hypothetical protein